jgi:hypothetical protein
MFFKSARYTFAAWFERHRLPHRYAPAIFVSTVLISFIGLSQLFSVWFGVPTLWSASAARTDRIDSSDADTLVFELRARSYTDAAEMELLLLQLNLDAFRASSDPGKREVALRQVKEARELAIRHLEEATAIALPPGSQPDIAAVRADLAEFDRQIAAMPGTGQH